VRTCGNRGNARRTWCARAAATRRAIRIGTVNPLASATGQACRGFAEAVAASPVLAEAFQAEVHANGELGGELEMTKACINGSLELAVTASNVVANISSNSACWTRRSCSATPPMRARC
jgi:TRAP-type C4-dicarboxylate transport system substrate-binding protein